MRTRLTDLLGIAHPIVQAPLGSAAAPPLASAVSQAGALGHVSVSFTPPEAIADLVAAVRATTDRPFAGNEPLSGKPQAVRR